MQCASTHSLYSALQKNRASKKKLPSCKGSPEIRTLRSWLDKRSGKYVSLCYWLAAPEGDYKKLSGKFIVFNWFENNFSSCTK